MSVRDFPRVFLPDDALDHRYSVTFGKAENLCPRSAYLYVKHGGGAAAHPLERGSALHRVLELATRHCIERGEVMIPPEVVKDIANEVLADPAYRCPIEEHDYIRESAYRWAREVAFSPAHVVAVETLMVLDVDGWQVRAKIDFAELIEKGAALRLHDYKSSRTMPTFEDIGRKRPDGSIAAKDYQLVLYALCCAFGRPVRVERCGTCWGAGSVGDVPSNAPAWGTCEFCHGKPVGNAATWQDGEPRPPAACPRCGMTACAACGGRGRVEIVEPFSVAGQAQRFDLAYVFPGIEGRDGLMAKRDVSLTRLELHEYLESVRAQVAHVEHRRESGNWPAVRGSHCTECPAPAECPIPEVLRTFAGTINTAAEAAEAAEQLDGEKAIHQARWKEIVRFAKTLPGQRLRFGRDQVIEPGYSEQERIADKDGMFAAMERAVRYGEPFERSSFVKVVKSAALKQRRLTEAELAEELAEGSNQEEAA